MSSIRASGSSLLKVSTSSTMPSRSRLSPRYITNGESARNGSAVSTAWARPSGASCSMYSIATPNCEPSPAAARISPPVSGAMMIPTSRMPAAAMASIP